MMNPRRLQVSPPKRAVRLSQPRRATLSTTSPNRIGPSQLEMAMTVATIAAMTAVTTGAVNSSKTNSPARGVVALVVLRRAIPLKLR